MQIRHSFSLFIIMSMLPLAVVSGRADKLSPGDLRDGDVLLYHDRSPVSWCIRKLDGSEYSHAGIYYGHGVLEAVAKGVRRVPLAESVAKYSYVDVYRHRQADDSSQRFDLSPVIERIRHYEKEGDRYAYEQFSLLAGLALTRRVPLALAAPIVRSVLDDHALIAADALQVFDRTPMICSELVFRCYAEADSSGGYALALEDELRRNSASRELAEALRRYISDQADLSDRRNFLTPPWRSYLAVYLEHKTDPHAARQGVVSAFVTPRDLRDSPSLVLLGRLALDEE